MSIVPSTKNIKGRLNLRYSSIMTEFDVPLLLLILKQICFGSLISGLLIFFLTLILQGSQLFDHDTDLDHDIDHDFDHGVGIDHDLGGVDLDVDVDIDSDLTRYSFRYG